MNNEDKYNGCEKLNDGRYRIREKMTMLPVKCKEPITEKIMVEGKEVSPKRKYKFCVWNDDFNGNGRSYKYVIPRVIKENRPTFCLADHPLDGEDGDSCRICGCGKNYRKENGWLVCDFYPLGELGNRIADGWDLGVPATISSSVLGELDNENYVMDSDSFFLERILDVLGCEIPSNGVYHYQDHNEEINDNYSFDTISESGFSEALTIYNKDKNSQKIIVEDKGEDIMSDTANDELIQQSMTLNIKSMIKDADKIESPFEKKEVLVSAESFAKKLTDETLHKEIVKKIEDVDNEIKELSAKGLQTDDLSEKVKNLTDENEKLESEIEDLLDENGKMVKKLKTLTDMYDEEQYKASETELRKTAMFERENRMLKSRINELKSKNSILESRLNMKNRLFESKMKKIEADSNTKVDAETVVEYKSKIKCLEDEVAELKAQLKKSEFALKKATGDLDNVNDELESVKKAKKISDAVDVEVGAEEIVALKEKINELTSKNLRLRKALNTSRMEKLEAKQSRFATLRKSIENNDDVVVDDSVMENEINDDDITVNSNGISVERDDDAIMEKMLRGEIK